MITLIEALNYRCLRYIRQPLGPFHVLVGPNASGKSVFLDVLLFLQDFFTSDLETAVNKRSPTRNFFDLVWGRDGDFFELALEVKIPESYLPDPEKIIDPKMKHDFDTIRYELRLKFDREDYGLMIEGERAYLKKNSASPITKDDITETLFEGSIDFNNTPHFVLEKGSPLYSVEYYELDKVHPTYGSTIYDPNPRLKKSTIFNVHYGEAMGPTFSWFRDYIKYGINLFLPNNETLKNPTPPGPSSHLKTDYSNICLVIEHLQKRNPELFHEWILHLQTALPDLDTILLYNQEEKYSVYMMLRYTNGLEVPSWLVSEGTLRLIALTLPAYLPDNKGVYLFEEPENGIHPYAINAIMQSMQSFYDGQVFITTHDPALVRLIDDLEQILCFTQTLGNGTKIVKGSEHPALKNWREKANLGTLFAGGFLGK